MVFRCMRRTSNRRPAMGYIGHGWRALRCDGPDGYYAAPAPSASKIPSCQCAEMGGYRE